MIKRNLAKAIISSLLILLPILFGVIVWDSLPEVITTHFGINGEPDGFSGRGFAVLFFPLFMLTIHWLCILVSAVMEAHGNGQSDKVYGLLFFICPLLSIVTSAMIYSMALGGEINISVFIAMLFGVMFIVIGNYIPKATRNRYFGIKLKWTLDNDENWAATHRLAGKVWVIGGFAVILTALLPIKIMIAAFIALLLALVLIPTVYSYVYYRKQLDGGEITKEAQGRSLNKKQDKIIGIATIAFIVVLFSVVAVLMFTGDVTATVGEEALTIEATYYDTVVLKYDQIDSVEYRESGDLGTRQFGYGSARLLLGIFKSSELGSYTRYTYTAPDAYILIRSGEKVLVVGLESDTETKALFDELILKTGD